MEAVAAPERTTSRERWESLRRILLPDGVEDDANKQKLTPSQRRWELLRETLIEDTPLERPESGRDGVDASPFPHTPIVEAGTDDTPMTDAADAVAVVQEGDKRPEESQPVLPASVVLVNEEQQQNNEPLPQSTVSPPVEAPREWGTPAEIETMNSDIREGLELLGIPSPARFFMEGVENFPSVGHYYVHLMRKLDVAGIDLMESFSSRLGDQHPLVAMMKSMIENEPPRTYLTREPTTLYDQRLDAARNIACPGMQEFSGEARALSWVIRTGPRSVQPAGSASGVESVLPPIPASVRNESTGYSESLKTSTGPGVIVCPGLPLSTDSPETYPTINPALAPRPRRQNLWTRVMGCFCISA